MSRRLQLKQSSGSTSLRPATREAGDSGRRSRRPDRTAGADLERTASFWGAALGYWWKPLENADGQYLSLLPGSRDGIELLLP